MPAISIYDVDQRLKSMSGWRRDGEEIVKDFDFPGFARAIAFVNAVAAAAEAADHHPDIEIKYNKVRMTLSTHSESAITEKDFALARQIDAAAG